VVFAARSGGIMTKSVVQATICKPRVAVFFQLSSAFRRAYRFLRRDFSVFPPPVSVGKTTECSVTLKSRILNLCNEALAAKTPDEFARTISELRAALQEHIRQAKNSLEAQVGNFPLLGGIANKSSWKK
jgi:hypothetical protein